MADAQTETTERDQGLAGRLKRFSRRVGPVRALGLASIIESTLLPLPIETVLVPAMLANRDKVWWIAASVTLGCILGSALCWLAGAFLLEPLVAPLLDQFGASDQLTRVQENIRTRGPLAILTIGLSPIPLPIATVGAGASGLGLPLTLATVALARSARYFGIALLVALFGEKVSRWMQRYWPRGPLGWLLGAALIALAIAVLLL